MTAVPSEPSRATASHLVTPRPIPVPVLREVVTSLVWAVVVPALAALAFLLAMAAEVVPSSATAWVLPLAALPGALGMWWWLHRQGLGARDVGLTRPRRSLAHLVWEVPLAIMGSAVIAALVAPLLGVSAGGSEGALASGGLDLPSRLAMLVTSVAVIPLLEEICFRYFLLGWLRRAMPVGAAVVASAVVFGLVHVAPAIMCYVIPLGVALAWVRTWHGTLWASVVLHACNNAVVTLVLLAAL